WVESCENETKQYVPEKYQLGIIADYLQEQNIEFGTEQRIFCYPIDIVGVRNGETYAIEMKSGDLSRGLEQAHRDASFVDYSYLSVWDDRVSESLVEQAENLPIGLMSVGERVEILVEAEKSTQQLCSRENVIKLINGDVRDDASVQKSQ
ncbi:hypothetical protein D320_06103, partial [Haloferax sp. BAB-2207]